MKNITWCRKLQDQQFSGCLSPLHAELAHHPSNTIPSVPRPFCLSQRGLKNVFDEAILAALVPPNIKSKRHCFLL